MSSMWGLGRCPLPASVLGEEVPPEPLAQRAQDGPQKCASSSQANVLGCVHPNQGLGLCAPQPGPTDWLPVRGEAERADQDFSDS